MICLWNYYNFNDLHIASKICIIQMLYGYCYDLRKSDLQFDVISNDFNISIDQFASLKIWNIQRLPQNSGKNHYQTLT